MLMRPAPSHATGPSPSITTLGTATHRVHPGLEQPPRTPLAIALAVVLPSTTPQQLFHLPPGQRHRRAARPEAILRDGEAAAPRTRAGGLGGITCGNCRTDHRSFPRPRHPGDGYEDGDGDGSTGRRNTRVPRNVLRVRTHRAAVDGGSGSRVTQVLDRVPFHAAFADDPAFRRLDQGVVADDNTENHRRRVPPPCTDHLSNYDAKIYSTITDAADTTARRVPGGRYRQRHRVNVDGTSTPREDQVEEEEEEVFGSRWRSPAESDPDSLEVHVQRPSDEERGQHGGLDVAQVPQATGPQRQQRLRGRQTARRVDERTCGLVFLLYLLALPILCATNGSPPGDRGSLAFTHNVAASTHAHNSSHRNSSPTAAERHPYRDYSWEVNQINPWLSACDLAGPAPADLQGSCGPPETPKNCPDACRKPDARSSRAVDPFSAVVGQADRYVDGGSGRWAGGGGRAAPEQCLFYLDESHKTEICRDDFGKDSSRGSSTVWENRYRFLSGLRLRHCCEHAALNALAPGDGGPLEEVLGGNDGCRIAIGKLLAVDALAARLHCEFGEVLARYDCGQPYSVIYNCTHCKEAYRRWVCSSLVPYFAHDDLPRQNNHGTGMRIRPCRSFCQSVEQRCPYLLPGDRAPAYPTQYAGEPTFLCRDPNIPETGEQASRALHADEECCFHVWSDEDPGRGVRANCTEPQVEIDIRGGNAQRDPSTAPQCELSTTASSSGQHQSTTSGTPPDSRSTTEPGSLVGHPGLPGGGVEGLEVTTGTSNQVSSSSGSGASFCGSGGVGSMSSGAAPRLRSGPLRQITAVMCAFCAWGAIIGLCTIRPRKYSRRKGGSSPCSGRLACNELIGDGDRRGPRPRGTSAAETIYLRVITSCYSIGSLLLGTCEIIGQLSSAWSGLSRLKLKSRYRCHTDLRSLLDDKEQEDRRSPRNYNTRPRRRHSRGSKRRRKKKHRRAS